MYSSASLNSEKLPTLDGWRAFSIALVLIAHSTRAAGFPKEYHSVFNWLSFGGFGVRTFFVISGFLITWLMLREHHRSGAVNLWRFYARRSLRILPVYFVFLGVVVLAQWLTPFAQNRGAWLANLTFTTGLFLWGGEGVPWTTGHLWSLAVEEQFYVFWPVLFVLLSLSNRTRLALVLLSAPVVVAPVCRVVGYKKGVAGIVGDFFGPYTFTTNFDALAVGCAAAVLLFHHRREVEAFLLSRERLLASTAILLIVLPHVLSSMLLAGYFTVPFGPTLQAFGVALLILQSVLRPGSGIYPMLNFPSVAWVGMLSYSLYIWQQLFCTHPSVFGLGDVWWMSFPGWLLTTFTVAFLSFYLLEQPLMRLRAKLR